MYGAPTGSCAGEQSAPSDDSANGHRRAAPARPVRATVEAPAAKRETRRPAGRRQRWVEPVNGDCPDGYPVKANDNSGIYHVPGGRFYDRTVAERCYANADDAVADGYRPAKA